MVAVAAADFAVEAVPERLELKREVWRKPIFVLRPEAILATNTSSISITLLAAATRRADRFVGMHFMNPVPVMALVEVIRALQTGDAAFATTMQLCEKIGKKPVAVNDSPGFVSNRVLMPLINEAAFCVMEGVATPEAVDAVMKTGHEPPDGSAGTGRFYRAGRLRRRDGSALRGFRRSEIPRLPAAAQDGRRRLAGPEIGPRLLPVFASMTIVDAAAAAAQLISESGCERNGKASGLLARGRARRPEATAERRVHGRRVVDARGTRAYRLAQICRRELHAKRNIGKANPGNRDWSWLRGFAWRWGASAGAQSVPKYKSTASGLRLCRITGC